MDFGGIPELCPSRQPCPVEVMFFVSYLLFNIPGLEQPMNFVLPQVTTLRTFLSYVNAHRVRLAFGTPSLKPGRSTAAGALSLERSCPDGRFTGRKGDVSGTL